MRKSVIIYFKFRFFSLLVLAAIDTSFAITVDSNNCIEFNANLAKIYPDVPNPKMRYYLFTAANLLEGDEIKDGDVNSLKQSKFNKDLPTRLFIGDWKAVPQNCKTSIVKDAYVKKGGYNFILVDWTDWSTKDFIPAARSVNLVGGLIGNFTKFLNANGVSFDKMYLIGQGFGAHVAGAAGSSIAPNKYDTIYALDATGVGFSGLDAKYRLDPSDAKYVEAIQTDILLWGYGSDQSLGHSQFYPNNGVRFQPMCPYDPLIIQACSHTAATDYFANSLKAGVKYCGSKTTWNNVFFRNVPSIDPACSVIMGGDLSIKSEGYFYVPATWP